MISRLRKEFRVAQGFLLFAGLKTFGQGLFFLLSLVTARLLTPDRFGAYSLGMMVAYLFAALFVSTSQNPFIVLASEERRATGAIRKAFSARALVLTAGLTVSVVLAVVFAEPLRTFAVLSGTEYACLLLAYLGICLRYLMEGTLLGLNRKQAHAAFGAASNVIGLIAIGALATTGYATLGWLFLVFLLSPVAASLAILPRMDFGMLRPLSIDRGLVRQFLGYMRWTVVGVIGVYLINWGDNLVLRHYVTLADIGVYNLAYQVFKGLLILTGIVQAYFLPTISERLATDTAKIKDWFLGVIRWRILGAGVAGLAVLWLIVPWFFGILYGPEYGAAVPVTRVLLIGAAFVLYQSFYAVIFDASKGFRFTQLAQAGGVAVNLSLDILLVPHYGIIGTAMATVTTYASLTALYAAYWRFWHRARLD